MSFSDHLTETCSIYRRDPKRTDTLGMSLGSEALETSGVACLLDPLKTSDDMIVAGHVPERTFRLQVATGTDVKNQDIIVVDDTRYRVISPPNERKVRGVAHHIEVICERQEVS